MFAYAASSSSSASASFASSGIHGKNAKLARMLRSKPGLVARALDAWEGPPPDTRTYNLVLAAKAKARDVDGVDATLRKMEDAGVAPDVVTYTTAMSAAFAARKAAEGMRYYALLKEAGLAPSHITYQVLLTSYLARNEVLAAERVLSEYVDVAVSPARNRIDSLKSSGGDKSPQKGGSLAAAQRAHDVAVSRANKFATFILAAYTKSREQTKVAVDEIARFLTRLTDSIGIVPDVKLYTTLVSAYAKTGNIKGAEATFQLALDSARSSGIALDAPVYNALLHALLKARRSSDVLKYLQTMNEMGVSANTVTYSILLQTHLRSGNYDQAASVFATFRDSGLAPDVIMYNILISGQAHKLRKDAAAVGDASATDDTSSSALPSDSAEFIQSILGSMEEDDVSPNVRTLTALVDLAGTGGYPEMALSLLETFPEEYGVKPNVFTYNVALRVALAEGMEEMAVQLQDRMKSTGIMPDVVTYTTLAKYGQISDADRTSFISFLVQKGLKPDRGSYSVALRELLDASLSEDAWMLLVNMPPYLRSRVLQRKTQASMIEALAGRDPGSTLPDGTRVTDALSVIRGEVRYDDLPSSSSSSSSSSSEY